MAESRRMDASGWLFLVISFSVALWLTVVPMPEWLTVYRPDWVALVMIYWALVVPRHARVELGWLFGLLLDVMFANLLGVHAMGLALIAFLVGRMHLQMRMFPWWQQAVSVLLLLLLYRGVTGWVRTLIGQTQLDHTYWIPCVVGMVLWPWLSVLLSDVRRLARVG